MILKRCLLVFLIAASIDGFGQSLAVKPGLWESQTLDDDGTASKQRECLTAEQIRQVVPPESRPGCKITVTTDTPRKTVLDYACTTRGTSVSVHAERNASDDEHMKTVITTNAIVDGKPNLSTIKGDAHFITANCGKVKPGEPEEVH